MSTWQWYEWYPEIVEEILNVSNKPRDSCLIAISYYNPFDELFAGRSRSIAKGLYKLHTSKYITISKRNQTWL